MSGATFIDGKAIAAKLCGDVATAVAGLKRDHSLTPGLAVVLVGEDPASEVYVRNKGRQTSAAGMASFEIKVPATTSQADLLDVVRALNLRDDVDGILVQLPLPPHIDAGSVIEAIDPAKDVDGFHYQNVGALVVGDPAFYPCTPWGVMKMLEHEGIAVEGMHAVVVGRSTIVGKPMALMLVNAGATVTVCHSKTRDLAAVTRQADLLVAAVGRARMIGAGMVKPGAIVVDVGINRTDGGKLCGDVDHATVVKVASRITPVPGGVGPMTIAMLVANTVRGAEKAAGLASPMPTRIA